MAGAPERLTRDPALEMLPTLSGDGRKLAFISNRMGNTEVWLRDLETGKEQALTASPQSKFSVVISRDGSRVAYGAIDNRTQKIYVIPTSGGVPEVVCDGCGPPVDWSADGARLLFQIFRRGEGIFTVGLLDLTNGQPMELLEYPGHSLFRAHFSFDDRWIAVHADDPQGVTREMIVPFRPSSRPAAGDWIAVTDGATFDDTPRWSPDGKLLYYLSDRDNFRCVWAQRLQPQTMHPLGPPFPVQHFHAIRSSPGNVDLSALDIFVAENRMLINLGEVTGNIWLANP
jgi:Tol biopolymer transport system component